MIIDEAMVEVRSLSGVALGMMVKANEMIITERNHALARLHKERAHHSRESGRLRRKQVMSIEKLQQEQASLVKVVQSKSNMKYHKVREDVANVSNKLKEQQLMRKTKIRDID